MPTEGEPELPAAPLTRRAAPPHNKHVARLSSALREAAAEAARSALHNYADDQESRRREAALSTGAAAEYLVRATIAAQDPVLLADRRTPASLVALSRANTAAPLDLRKLKTVGIMEAVEMLGMIHPALSITTDARLIMDVRNAAAHLALVDVELLAEAVAKLVQITGGLLDVLGTDEEAFWGADLVDVVAAMKDEYATAVTRRVQAKLAHARTELERLVGSLTAEDRERTLVILESRSVPWITGDAHAEQPQPCPACGRRGLATYSKDRGDDFEEEYVYDQHGDPEDTYLTVDVYFRFSLFQCPVCSLYLEQGEEVATSIPEELEPQREMAIGFLDSWEPDEDWARGR